MPEILKSINDEKLFEDYFNRFFQDKNVFIRLSDANISVDYLSYSGSNIELKIPVEFNEEHALIFVRHEDLIIFSKMAHISQNEEKIHIFKPSMIQVMRVPRKENRKNVPDEDKGEAHEIKVSDIVSEWVIKDSLERDKKKISFIKDKMLEKIGDYLYSSIFFYGEKANDVRIKYFMSDKKPLFIPDINNKGFINTNQELYDFYNTSIFKTDKKLDWLKIISEISVPVMYRLMFPMGYIQINHSAPLSDDLFKSIRKMGYTFSELLTQQKIIVPHEDTAQVDNLSKSGLSVVFFDRKKIKHFKDGNYIYFNISLPEGKSIPLYCQTKYINIEKNKCYRVGFEIVDIDAIGEAHFDEYLEKLG